MDAVFKQSAKWFYRSKYGAMDFKQAKLAQSSDKFRNIYLDNGQIGATSQELISLWPNDEIDAMLGDLTTIGAK